MISFIPVKCLSNLLLAVVLAWCNALIRKSLMIFFCLNFYAEQVLYFLYIHMYIHTHTVPWARVSVYRCKLTAQNIYKCLLAGIKGDVQKQHSVQHAVKGHVFTTIWIWNPLISFWTGAYKQAPQVKITPNCKNYQPHNSSNFHLQCPGFRGLLCLSEVTNGLILKVIRCLKMPFTTSMGYSVWVINSLNAVFPSAQHRCLIAVTEPALVQGR